jgi:nicotinamide-nucleotide amidase
MRAEILSIGTELLLGTITDTNASYLAQRLALLGIDCYYVSQVGDNLGRLTEILQRAWGRSELVVATGGLGPTQDDLTREAIAAMLGETPEVDPQLEAQLRGFFRRRGYEMPPRNLKQAAVIPSARPIDNPVGTAPGWWVERQTEEGSRVIVAMPGVPFEMTRMWEREVEPRLRQLSDMVIASRTLKVLGMGESAVEQKVEDLMQGSNPTLAPYAKRDGVHLRITAKATDQESAHEMIARLESQVRDRLGEAVYGADDESPASVAQRLLESLDATLALVEVGEGAIGSVTPHLAHHRLARGALSASNVEVARSLLSGVHDGRGLTGVEGIAQAMLDRTGADVVLAVSATSDQTGEHTGSALAEVEVVLLTRLGDNTDVSSSRHRWRTASSEVSRLAGLAALNDLRLSLLARLERE